MGTVENERNDATGASMHFSSRRGAVDHEEP
jgi:hypothetical protein